MNRYWVSWYQPTDDFRPVVFPPTHGILGWWCSGYDSDDTPILVALVEAEDEEMAEDALIRNWPETEGIEFRFFDQKESDYLPGDRFPLPDWSPLKKGKSDAASNDDEDEKG
jgi:hypothetical protein